MAAHGARRLLPMAENLTQILGIELLAGCQGCDFHAPLRSSAPLERVRALAARARCRTSTTTATWRPTSQRRPSWCARAPSSRGDARCRAAANPCSSCSQWRGASGDRMTRIDNARGIRAPRGTEISRQELADRSAAAHADEQPRPRGGGEARRAGGLRRHRPRRARLGELRPHRRGAAHARGRRDAAGAVGQAGRRVPHARRCAARADRQLQPRAALGDLGALQRARSQGPDDVRPDDGRLVDLHRQPGHRAGHLRDLRRGRPAALRRRPRRQLDPDRRARRHGRRAAAGRDDGRRLDAGRRVPAEPHRDAAARPAISTRRPRRSTRRWR